MNESDVKNLSFEESMSKLENTANIIKGTDVTLEEAMQAYEEGLVYYNRCTEILNNAKQKIELYEK